MMMGGFGGMGMGIGWLWILALPVIMAAVVWQMGAGGRWRRGAQEGGRTQHDRAREILRERYARGEIAEDELRDRLRALDHR